MPDAVTQECGSVLLGWVQVHSAQNQTLVQSLKLDLGAGEAEAIALSVECSAARLILDDKKARRIAHQLNQPVTGTLAVLVRAKDLGILLNVRDVIDALVRQLPSFRCVATGSPASGWGVVNARRALAGSSELWRPATTANDPLNSAITLRSALFGRKCWLVDT